MERSTSIVNNFMEPSHSTEHQEEYKFILEWRERVEQQQQLGGWFVWQLVMR